MYQYFCVLVQFLPETYWNVYSHNIKHAQGCNGMGYATKHDTFTYGFWEKGTLAKTLPIAQWFGSTALAEPLQASATRPSLPGVPVSLMSHGAGSHLEPPPPPATPVPRVVSPAVPVGEALDWLTAAMLTWLRFRASQCSPAQEGGLYTGEGAGAVCPSWTAHQSPALWPPASQLTCLGLISLFLKWRCKGLGP